LNSLSERLS